MPVTGKLDTTRRRLRLDLNGMGRLGEATAVDGDKQVFVMRGIPGETVVAEIVSEHRRHVTAQVVEVLEPSPHRVAPPCPHFGPCTGCQWQHVAYEHQLELKRRKVCDALERIADLPQVHVDPTLASPQPLGYRNHARLTVSRDQSGRLGFVNRATLQWVEVNECLIMAPEINQAIAALQGRVAETTQLSLRWGINTGSWMLQPSFRDPQVPLPSGQNQYEESLLGHTFQVSSPSFFQVNTRQAEQMAQLVRQGLALTGQELVVDAYAGVGAFAVLLAGEARRVVAIEESPAALEDARRNTADTPNVELRRGKVETVLGELAGEGVDAAVLDPPRAGCHPAALAALITAAPRRVAYVSCNPETLARDLKILTGGPYRIERVQPVDMFPQTHQVECIALLSLDPQRQLRQPERQQLVLASASPRRQELLARLGLELALAPTNVVEPPGQWAGEDAVTFSGVRALVKAHTAAENRDRGTVIAADTVVELEGAVLGKPRDKAEATAMLRALRGREHRVVTSIALVDAASGESAQAYRATRVVMRQYTDEEIEAYVASGDPMDKAGAYAVQHEGLHPAAQVRGCYLNVVGLPVCTLFKTLDRFGVTVRLQMEDSAWPELERCPACASRVMKAGRTTRG